MTQFADANAIQALAAMSPAMLDALPFGVIVMHVDGTVTHYNLKESECCGLAPSRVVGRIFFTEIAPCTNNFIVADRMRNEDELDATVDYVFSVKMKPTPVTLRMLRSRSCELMYLLVDWKTES